MYGKDLHRQRKSHPVVFDALQNLRLHALHHLRPMLRSEQLCAAADRFPHPYFCVFKQLQASSNNALPLLEVLLML